MSQLSLITLGPVQEFIAAARRTRDLWFGSHILSELSRACARGVLEAGGELIIPAIEKDEHTALTLNMEPFDTTGRPALNVANKILAEIPDGVNPEDVVRAGMESAREALDSFAQRVEKVCSDMLDTDVADIWEEQLDTLLELHAVWCPMGDDYAAARARLEREVAARKNLKAFASWSFDGRGRPKSSLDGARASVLRARASETRRAGQLRISDGEHLDAVGLLKRAGGRPDQFVPIGNVAAARWLETRSDGFGELVGELRQLYQRSGWRPIQSAGKAWVDVFPYDAQLFYPGRAESILEELGVDPEVRSDWTREYLSSFGAAPTPYVACLVADGDRMGAALDGLKTPEAHRRFSRELASFAREARGVVETGSHRGVLVYAGGDDVLAFVCVEDAIACSGALRELFDGVMGKALPGVAPEDRPTLSVGLGVGHFLDGMGHLLSLGRRAEALAKGKELASHGLDRNALAILLDKRSGGETTWRERWEHDPVARMEQDTLALAQGAISSKKIYEIRADVSAAPHPRDVPNHEDASWARLLAADTRRTLGRSDDTTGASPEQVGLDLDPDARYADVRAAILKWSNRMILVRTLAQASSIPSPTRTKEARS